MSRYAEGFFRGVIITEWCVFDNERNYKKTVKLRKTFKIQGKSHFFIFLKIKIFPFVIKNTPFGDKM